MSDNKVYLINLPSPWMVNEHLYPPLGLMYLYEYLKINGVDVAPIIDLAGKADPDEWVIPEDGNYYGISSTTPQFPFAQKVAQKIKHINPEARTILGGIHVTAMECSVPAGFWGIVRGEGERTLLSLVSDMRKVKEIKSIDEFPHPRLSSIDSKYSLKVTFNFQGRILEHLAGWLLTSRGCPYNCSFCASHCMWRSRVRLHSIEYLQGWVDYWIKRGIHSFNLIDEQIGITEKRLFEICDLLKPAGGYWRCLMRGDKLTPEKAKKMYDAGCRQITIGVESGSQKMLDACNKNEQVGDNQNAIHIAHDAGIGVKATVMVGLPGETQKDIDLTKKFLERADPDEVQPFIFVPHPGCDIYENPEKYGYNLNRDMKWEDYICVSGDPMTPVFDKGKEAVIRDRKRQLLNAIGARDLLTTHKDRWKGWKRG